MIKPSIRLIAAIWLAIGFVLFRVLYVIIFTGASSGDPLVDMPGISLGGIFSHVTLFGPIGLDGLVRSLISALPFAIAILAFGLFSFFVGPELIGRFALRTKSNFLRALGVGISVLPAIAEAAERVSTALSYRSAPKRYALVPLLETAIARSSAVSEAMLPSAAADPLDDLVLISREAEQSIELKPSDALVVRGVTGSGKTTLLRSIAARPLEPGRQSEASIFGFSASADPKSAASFSRYVPQQPRDLFLEWKLDPSLRTAWLSEGEAVKHAISIALEAKPNLLVLDEPYASLDDASCDELNRQLAEYRNQGGILVVAEHEVRRINLPGAIELTLSDPYARKLTPRSPAVVGREQLFTFEGNAIQQADLIALSGPNGVGKTTYLKRLLARATAQKLSVRFIPERVEDLFLSQSLVQEFELSDKLSKSKPGTTRANFESLLPVSETLGSTHPRDLSAGTKLALALSIVLALKPQLLLIDEPVKGLDTNTRILMAEVLGCVQETGCAIVFATHDAGFASIANKKVELLRGVSQCSPSAL